MRFALLLMLSAGLSSVVGCGQTRPVNPSDKGSAAVDDKTKLQGIWKVEAFETANENDKLPDKERESIRIMFSDNTITIPSPSGRAHDKFTFALDTTQDPKVLVVTALDDEGKPRQRYSAMTARSVGTARYIEKANPKDQGEVERMEWIYKLEGDKLVLAIGKGVNTRPKEFKAIAGTPRRFTTSKAVNEPEVPPVIVITLKKTDETGLPEPKRESRPTTIRGTSK